MDTNEKIKIVGTNIQEKANLIWNVANSLFGAYKPHEYGLVILPMVVIKRFHDCLLPTREKVLATYEKVKQLAVKDGFLRTASGYRFWMCNLRRLLAVILTTTRMGHRGKIRVMCLPLWFRFNLSFTTLKVMLQWPCEVIVWQRN